VRLFRNAGGRTGAVLAGLVAGAGMLTLPAVFPDGPPPGRTGGFGEPTCQVCHADASVNVWGDGLSIGSLPKAYVPGETYRLSVTLTRPGMGRGGFQVSARFADGRAGVQAGLLKPADSTTFVAILSNRSVQYLSHTLDGARLTAPDTATWWFDWKAPANGPAGKSTEVIFNVAANAANNDQSEFGDRIYIREFRVRRDKR
jgi:hypothetical protein